MKCLNQKINTDSCSCTYPGCPRKGICCECLKYHLPGGQLPGCAFSPEAEATYDRSIEYYLQVCKKK